MARRAKVPKVKQRWTPKMFVYIDSGRGGWDVSSVRSVIAKTGDKEKCQRICRALNLLEAVERGEVKVEEQP